jgi:ribosomal protein S18 acetylase RimI-like enzyme
MSSEPAIRVRDARPDERAAIRELTLTAYAEYASAMEPSAWALLREAVLSALATDQPVERIVAEQDGVLLGSVLLYPPAAAAYAFAAAPATLPELRLLAVLPAARGRGIGQMLVDECVRRARAMGASALGLHTSRSMRAARRMYERMGFVRAPEDDFRPPGAELVEAYRLPLTT